VRAASPTALNRKYRAPSTNGRPVYPLVRYSALQRSDRLAFTGQLSPPPPKTLASLSPSLRGGVPLFATHLRTSHRNLPSGGPKPDESRSPRIATASHSSPARELDRTAVEFAEILAHLFEREPEGKKALRGVDRQTERQSLSGNFT
jgi:hypothetical protein